MIRFQIVRFKLCYSYSCSQTSDWLQEQLKTSNLVEDNNPRPWLKMVHGFLAYFHLNYKAHLHICLCWRKPLLRETIFNPFCGFFFGKINTMSLEINIFSFEIIICSLEIGYILLRNRHMFFRNEFFVETHTEDLWTAAISLYD